MCLRIPHPIIIPPICRLAIARNIAEATARDIAEAQAQARALEEEAQAQARALEEEAKAREQATKVQRMQRWLAIAIQSRCRGIRARRYVQERAFINAATKVNPQNTIYYIYINGCISTWHLWSAENTRNCLFPMFPMLYYILDPSCPAWENGL
jgi:hypothetical protein